MNRVEISGRLTRDPEIRYLGGSRFPVVSLNVGVDDGEGRWNAETRMVELRSGFYKVEVAGQLAEWLQTQVGKGDEVYVVGSLNQFTIQGRDGKEGQTRTQIRAKVVTVLTPHAASVSGFSAPDNPLDDTEASWAGDEEPF
jgi:single-strand DNA-binding protein